MAAKKKVQKKVRNRKAQPIPKPKPILANKISKAGFEASLAKWEQIISKELEIEEIKEAGLTSPSLADFENFHTFEEKILKAFEYFSNDKLSREEFLNLILKWCSDEKD